VAPSELADYCEDNNIKCYTYSAGELQFEKLT